MARFRPLLTERVAEPRVIVILKGCVAAVPKDARGAGVFLFDQSLLEFHGDLADCYCGAIGVEAV